MRTTGAFVALAASLLVGRAAPLAAQAARPASAEAEIRQALAAAPAGVAAGAAVYVTGPAGYVLAREGTNGFTCLVERSVPGAVEPVCYDRETSATVLPRVLKEAALRAQGLSREAIARAVAEDYRTGALRPPARGAVAYMLAPDARVPDERTGAAIAVPPHYMVYLPYATNADLGHPAGSDADLEQSGAPFIVSPGEPTAFMVVWAD